MLAGCTTSSEVETNATVETTTNTTVVKYVMNNETKSGVGSNQLAIDLTGNEAEDETVALAALKSVGYTFTTGTTATTSDASVAVFTDFKNTTVARLHKYMNNYGMGQGTCSVMILPKDGMADDDLGDLIVDVLEYRHTNYSGASGCQLTSSISVFDLTVTAADADSVILNGTSVTASTEYWVIVTRTTKPASSNTDKVN